MWSSRWVNRVEGTRGFRTRAQKGIGRSVSGQPGTCGEVGLPGTFSASLPPSKCRICDVVRLVVVCVPGHPRASKPLPQAAACHTALLLMCCRITSASRVLLTSLAAMFVRGTLPPPQLPPPLHRLAAAQQIMPCGAAQRISRRSTPPSQSLPTSQDQMQSEPWVPPWLPLPCPLHVLTQPTASS